MLAYDSQLCARVIQIFISEIFSWLRRTAKRELGLRSVRDAHPGSVSFVQRFGDGLRGNLHLHTLALDGVYVQKTADEPPVFHALPAPSKLDVQVIGTNVWMRTTRLLQELGRYFDADPAEADTLAREHPLLAACCAAAIQNTVASGPRAGQGIMRIGARSQWQAENADTETSAVTPMHGFSAHAGTRVAARDRKRLERLCRYAARGPIASERLSFTPDGNIVYRLRRRWQDGTSHLVFTPRQLIQRLIALVPPPRFNLTRFHGVLAPASKLRPAVVPEPTAQQTSSMKQLRLFGRNGQPKQPRLRNDGRPRADPRARATWTQLLQRTFPEDRNVCPRCGGRLDIVVAALSPAAIRRFLELHPPTRERPVSRLPRGPPYAQLPLFATPQRPPTAA